MIDESKLVEAFDECLNALAGGATLDACLARFPDLQDELRPLLAVAGTATAMGASAAIPRQAEMASRARFLAGGAQLRPAPLARPRILRWPIPRAAFAALGLAVVMFGTYGAVTASARSLPGDALYGVKRMAEQAELLLTRDEAARAQLQAEFDERRAQEVQAVTAQKRTAQVEFSGVVESIEGARWQVERVAVVLSPETRVEGTPFVGAMVEVMGMSQVDGSVLAALISVESEPPTRVPPTATPTARVFPAATPTPTPLPSLTSTPPPTSTPLPPPTSTPLPPPTETSVPAASPSPTAAPTEQVEFKGVIESITENVWRVGGRDVMINSATEIRGAPQVGKTAEVKAVRDHSGVLIARRIEVKSGGDQPEASKTPKPSKTPTPGSSETPEPHGTDDDDETPEPSETPKPSNTPKPSETPEPSETHKPTKTPTPTP
jgi:hypothetical protein